MNIEIIALLLMIPWLLFDVYFLIMSIVLLVLKNRPATMAAELEAIPKLKRTVILIPTYNNSRTVLNDLVPQLMEWLRNQQDMPAPIILVDSSTDGSEELIAGSLNMTWDVDVSDRRITHRQNLSLIHLKDRSGGKAWAINRVALGLSAKYFAILDSDWVIDFEAIGKATHYLETHKHFVYAQMAWRAWDKPLNFVSGLDQVSIEYRHQFENRVRIWQNIPITIHGSAVVINTQDFCNAGGFRDSVLSEDVDLALRLMLDGKFGVGLSDLTMQQPPCNHINQFFWQKARWAEGRSQMLKMYVKKLLNSDHLTIMQKIVWVYYLAYFGRCVVFTVILALLVAGFVTHNNQLFVTCLGIIVSCLLLRVASHLVTMAHRVNKIPLICRLIEPFTFYGIGLLYTYTFFKGLFTTKGAWRVVESKTYT